MYLNKVQIIGNLTRDPELKALPSGVQVASFSVATNEVYYDKDKQKQEKVEFHNIVVFGKIAENVGRYLKKGSQVYVEGKLQTRSWDKDGVKMYRTEINALSVQFGSKPGGKETRSEQEDRGVDTDEAPDHTDDDINPEDIPF